MSSFIEKKANRFREQNGLSHEEAISLSSLLIKLEVNTLYRPLSADFSGLALKAGSDKFIMVNTSQSIGRQNFTLAHELYHLFIQEDFTFRTCSAGKFDKKADPEEYHADLFAAYLLMPASGILELIPDQELDRKKISLQTIIQLEQYFKVSRSAILYRLQELRYISYTEKELYSRSIIKSAREWGYDSSLYEPTNEHRFIGNYGKKAKSLFDGGKISEADYVSLMADIMIDVYKEENSLDD
jgi:Zn-dependent peptidase ImmA (M78 family)